MFFALLQGWDQLYCAVDRRADEAERALSARRQSSTRDSGGEELTSLLQECKACFPTMMQ